MQKGSIVVCIDDQNWHHDVVKYFKLLPVKGALYIVRFIYPNLHYADGPLGVALEEIRGDIDTIKAYNGEFWEIEIHFKISRFKEVLPPQKISIEDFMKINLAIMSK